MITKRARFIVFSSAMVLGGIAATMIAAQAEEVRPDTSVSLFRERVTAYTQLRQDLIANLQEVGIDPNAQDGGREFRYRLGLALREARDHARPGEIFCPEMAARMRNAVWQALLGQDDILSEVPEVVTVRVNDFYPEAEPLGTVPPSLLQRFELLPPELQYRFLGTALILLDVDTALIVDVIPDAFQRGS
jgi:hypothetical protein